MSLQWKTFSIIRVDTEPLKHKLKGNFWMHKDGGDRNWCFFIWIGTDDIEKAEKPWAILCTCAQATLWSLSNSYLADGWGSVREYYGGLTGRGWFWSWSHSFFFNVYLILFIHLAGSNSQCYVARACSVALHYFSEEIKQTRPFFKQMLLRGSDMKHERTCMTKVKVSITSGIHLLNNQTLLKALYSTIALFEQYFKV